MGVREAELFYICLFLFFNNGGFGCYFTTIYLCRSTGTVCGEF